MSKNLWNVRAKIAEVRKHRKTKAFAFNGNSKMCFALLCVRWLVSITFKWCAIERRRCCFVLRQLHGKLTLPKCQNLLTHSIKTKNWYFNGSIYFFFVFLFTALLAYTLHTFIVNSTVGTHIRNRLANSFRLFCECRSLSRFKIQMNFLNKLWSNFVFAAIRFAVRAHTRRTRQVT